MKQEWFWLIDGHCYYWKRNGRYDWFYLFCAFMLPLHTSIMSSVNSIISYHYLSLFLISFMHRRYVQYAGVSCWEAIGDVATSSNTAHAWQSAPTWVHVNAVQAYVNASLRLRAPLARKWHVQMMFWTRCLHDNGRAVTTA